MIGINFVGCYKKGGIHIKKENRGKFTDYCGGKVTDKCILKGKNSKDPKIRKRATFAANARAWSHEEGAKIHKPFGHRSILDNGWRTTKLLKDKKIPIGKDGIPGIYDLVVKEVKDLLKRQNAGNIGIKYIPEKRVKLTNAGKLTGAEFSTNMLDSIAKYGHLAGLPINEAVGLAALESALGNANTKGYIPLKSRGVIYGSSLISNWSHGRDNPMRDLLVTAEIQSGVRDIKKHGRNSELNLSSGDKKKVEPYLEKGLKYARRLTAKMNPDLNVLLHGFTLFKSGRFNPGDPNHRKDVIDSGNAVMKSPEFLNWWNAEGKKWYGF